MRKELWFAVALIAYTTARLLPPLAGLAGPSQAALGVTLAGTILWISEAVPLGVTALLVGTNGIVTDRLPVTPQSITELGPPLQSLLVRP